MLVTPIINALYLDIDRKWYTFFKVALHLVKVHYLWFNIFKNGRLETSQRIHPTSPNQAAMYTLICSIDKIKYCRLFHCVKSLAC